MSLMMILITRPKDSIKNLEKQLSELNIKYFTESLSKIKFKSQKFKKYTNKIYLVSSPRVIDLLIKKRSTYSKLKFLIIGTSSGKKMIQAGFKNILGVSENRIKMLSIIKKLKKVTEVEYLTGTTINKKFCRDIMRLNINLKIHNLYETYYIKNLSSKCKFLFRNKKIRIILLYSAANADHLIYLIKKSNLEKSSPHIKFLCLSKNIAMLVSRAGFKCYYTKKPNEISMISSIKRLY